MPSSSFFLGEARCCLAGSVCDGLGGRGLHSSASLFSASGSHSSLSPWVGRGATRSWPGFLSLRSFLSSPESCFLWPDSWRLHGGGLRLGVTREANRPPFMPHLHRFGAACLNWIASSPGWSPARDSAAAGVPPLPWWFALSSSGESDSDSTIPFAHAAQGAWSVDPEVPTARSTKPREVGPLRPDRRQATGADQGF